MFLSFTFDLVLRHSSKSAVAVFRFSRTRPQLIRVVHLSPHFFTCRIRKNAHVFFNLNYDSVSSKKTVLANNDSDNDDNNIICFGFRSLAYNQISVIKDGAFGGLFNVTFL